MRSQNSRERPSSPLVLSARSNGLLFSSKYRPGSISTKSSVPVSQLDTTWLQSETAGTVNNSLVNKSPRYSSSISSEPLYNSRSAPFDLASESLDLTPSPRSEYEIPQIEPEVRQNEKKIKSSYRNPTYKYCSLFTPSTILPSSSNTVHSSPHRFLLPSRQSSLSSTHSTPSMISTTSARTRFLLKHDTFATSKNLARLPSEVSDVIFQYLDQSSLVNLIHVCQPIYETATRHLYYSPYFSSCYRFAQFVSVIKQNPELAQLVYVFDLSHIRPGQEGECQESDFSFCNTAHTTEGDEGIVLAGWRDWKYRSIPFYAPLESLDTSLKSKKRPEVYPVSKALVSRRKDTTKIKRKLFPAPTSSAISSKSPTSPKSKRETFLNPLKKGWIYSFTKRQNKPDINGLLFVSLYNEHFSSLGPHSPYSPYFDNFSHLPSPLSPQSLIKSKAKISNVNNRTNASSTIDQSRYASHGRGPFSTPHPVQSVLLAKYANSRDIPVGYILHVLKCCKNLNVVDLSYLTLAEDYVIDRTALASATTSKALISSDRRVFLSDTHHANVESWPSSAVSRVGIWEIIHQLADLEQVQELTLQHCLWLTKSLIYRFFQNSKSVNMKNNNEISEKHLEWVDLGDSGMMKNLDWAVSGSCEDFLKMLEFKKPEDDQEDENYKIDSDDELFFESF
ncbi:hypothetical protein NADFUDRAFT_84294 [Nadsonia fulvescens var. elongata DSM 6958]|uniref:F-box domain-containing protein n=1 Tax=Nadsonia fulvescens var. elongata DSM 6958 TaxID=857566 RepID=A0A1E3PE61_9ASCO|nr:hypothetical protein NADFUDRAFT_84294 [Nadsonia fulvescens var. elongata DSM 6958]